MTTIYFGLRDGNVSIVDVSSPTFQISKTFSAHPDGVTSIAVSNGGHLLATTCATDNSIKLWNTDTLNCTATLQYPSTLFVELRKIYDCTFSPDDQTLISVSRDETITVWNLSTKTCTTLNEHKDWVICRS